MAYYYQTQKSIRICTANDSTNVRFHLAFIKLSKGMHSATEYEIPMLVETFSNLASDWLASMLPANQKPG